MSGDDPKYDPLFRREAVEDYLRGRDHGRLLDVSPLWSVWAFGVLVLVFVGAIAFAAFAPIGTDERAPAYVLASAGGGSEVVCVLPADAAAPAPGVRIAIEFGAAARVRRLLRAAWVGDVLAPEAARDSLGAGAAAEIAGPVRLVRAPLPADAALAPGAAGVAWVRTGSTTLLHALAFERSRP